MLATFLSSACVQAADSTPLSERVPSGALAYAAWAGRSLTFDGSMFGQLLQEQAIVQMMATLKSFSLVQCGEGQPRQTADSAWALASIAWQHPIALSLLDVSAGPDGPSPSAAAMIDLGKDREAFRKHLDAVMKGLGGESTIKEVTIVSVPCKVLKAPDCPEITVGYMGDVCFATIGQDAARRLIELPAGKSLRDDKKFAACIRAVAGDSVQAAFYVDVPALVERGEKFERPSPGEPTTMPGAEIGQARKTIDALGLGRLTAIAAATSIVDRGMNTRLRLFSPAPHKGLLMPFAGASLAEADIADAPDDADFVAACKLAPDAAYAELVRVLRDLDPQVHQEFLARIGGLEKSLGVSIADDLLTNLGDTWVLSSAPSQGGFLTGTLLTVKLKDPAKLAEAVAKIETPLRRAEAKSQPASQAVSTPASQPASGPRLETVLVGKTEIHYVAVGGTPMPFAPAWAIHGDKLYLAGWPQVIQTAIENAPGIKPLIQDAAFRQARGRVSAKPSILFYANTPGILRQVYGLLLLGWTTGANAISEQLPSPAKPAWLPALSKLEKYLWPEVWAVSSDPDGVTLESYGSLPFFNPGILPLNAAVGTAAWVTGRPQGAKAFELGEVK